MKNFSSQDEINQAEWENPDNWSGPDWMPIIYFSKRDSRRWVPNRRLPKASWNLNLGHSYGAWWLVAFLVGIPMLTILVSVLIFMALGY